MSLLLDALKKAAEQKAQKSKSEALENQSSDETLLDVEAVDETARLAGDDRPSAAGREDETIVEQTEIEERLARGDRIAGDDTRVDTPDTTETQRVDEQAEQTSFDVTGIDIADTTETLVEQGQADETVFDETGIDVPETTATVLADEPLQDVSSEDATGVDITESVSAEPVDPVEQRQKGEDETIVYGSDDVADFAADRELDSRRPVLREDVTDVNSIASAEDLDRGAPGLDGAADSDDSDPDTDDDTTSNAADVRDEDLSLMLQEPDPTITGATTGFTDPKIPAERTRVPTSADADLALADITQDRHGAEETDTQGSTLTNTTATVLHGDDTHGATTRSNLTRTDSTSTRTYAPDNYDRTLMKLPSDDASKLFAGMKSDADVVMTPDYAKKVFRSKSSTQRTRHYQTYLGIALILFGLVVGYGVMEYEAESTLIENSLRPLKNDPMPGIIKAQQEPEIDLFGESGGQVDSRTIEIIAGAADDVIASEPEIEIESTVVAEQAVGADDTTVAMVQPIPPQSNQAQSNQAQSNQAQSNQAQSVATSSDGNTGGGDAMTSTTNAQGNLNIKSSSQYRQADIWLREAYEAYQAGNYQLAMQRYNQVLRVDSGNRNALLGHAAISVHNGSIDAAIRDYQTLLLLNPKDSLAMSSLLAVASYSPQETESQLKLMIQDEPNSAHLNFALANAYGSQDRWQEAQGYYFKALQNNPEDPNYAYNLAVSLEHIAQPRSAMTYYQRALDNIGNGLATFNSEVVGQRLEVLGKL